jgi:hypothetical protein
VVLRNTTALNPDPPAFGIEDDRIVRVFRVSAATGAGVEELRRALFELVPQEEVVPELEETELVDFLVYRPQPARRAYRVFRTERGFRVSGARLRRRNSGDPRAAAARGRQCSSARMLSGSSRTVQRRV